MAHAAAEPTDQGIRHGPQPVADGGGVHDVGRQDEHRDRHQHVHRRHLAHHLAHQQTHILPRHKQVDGATAKHHQRQRQAHQGTKQHCAQQGVQARRHGACSRSAPVQRASSAGQRGDIRRHRLSNWRTTIAMKKIGKIAYTKSSRISSMSVFSRQRNRV